MRQQSDAVGAVAHCFDGIVAARRCWRATSMGTPSVVIAGRLAGASRVVACAALPRPLVAVLLADVRGRGRSRRYLRCRRRGSWCRRATSSTSSPAPTTAGIPSARARMAPWETGLPAGGDDADHLRRVESRPPGSGQDVGRDDTPAASASIRTRQPSR